jgi:hypothetical protein
MREVEVVDKIRITGDDFLRFIYVTGILRYYFISLSSIKVSISRTIK